jgi:hypothetical protein
MHERDLHGLHVADRGQRHPAQDGKPDHGLVDLGDDDTVRLIVPE